MAVHAEQEGTFISSTGQLGRMNQAVSNDGVRPDWQIISQLGMKMGFAMKYGNPKDIFRELAQKMPLWAGLKPGLSAPCPDFKPVLTGAFVALRDRGQPARTAALRPGGGEIPATLRLLHHPPSLRHPGRSLRGAKLKLNPEDAAGLGLAEGDTAKVISSQGEVSVPVTLALDLPAGLVFLPEHFAAPGGPTI